MMLSLTGQAVDHGRPLLLVLLLRCSAVLSIHFADGGGALSLDLGVKLLVKQNLVHQVRLHGAGLRRGFGGPVVVACMRRQHRMLAVEPRGENPRLLPYTHPPVLTWFLGCWTTTDVSCGSIY